MRPKEGEALISTHADTGISLLFAAGDRLKNEDFLSIFESLTIGNSSYACSTLHKDSSQRRTVEIGLNGLTFDLLGTLPDQACALPRLRQSFGVPSALADSCEAVYLKASSHIESGSRMLPIIQNMLRIAVALVHNTKAKAVLWHPAQTLMEAEYFTRMIEAWLMGGPFPALGLIALEIADETTVNSYGLTYFTGQEIYVVGQEGEAKLDIVKLAVRVSDYTVQHGAILQPQVIEEIGGLYWKQSIAMEGGKSL